MKKLYPYIGSNDLKNLGLPSRYRAIVRQAQDVIQWISSTEQLSKSAGLVVATFILDTNENLWIADRHSEHYICAQGKAVLSAGEITFSVDGSNVEVVEITNQSTGYCPEPESWTIVQQALTRARIPHPDSLTFEFVFRRCEKCSAKNVVKEGWFECGVCGAELSQEWNFG